MRLVMPQRQATIPARVMTVPAQSLADYAVGDVEQVLDTARFCDVIHLVSSFEVGISSVRLRMAVKRQKPGRNRQGTIGLCVVIPVK